MREGVRVIRGKEERKEGREKEGNLKIIGVKES